MPEKKLAVCKHLEAPFRNIPLEILQEIVLYTHSPLQCPPPTIARFSHHSARYALCGGRLCYQHCSYGQLSITRS